MIDPGCDYHSAGVLDYQTAQGPALPLLLDVPRSGTIAPDDFTPAVPADVWQSIADPFVDDLVVHVRKVVFVRRRQKLCSAC